MLLQAYDFLELSRRHDACLQLGEWTLTPLESMCCYIPDVDPPGVYRVVIYPSCNL